MNELRRQKRTKTSFYDFDDGTMSTYQSNHSVLFVYLDAHINLILASFGIFQATVLEIAHELIHVKLKVFWNLLFA